MSHRHAAATGVLSVAAVCAFSIILSAAWPIAIPLGLDLYMPVPEDNPLTLEKIEQGSRLFRDRRLSRDGSISCATCHDPGRGFSSAAPLAIGVSGLPGARNAPALINRGYGRAFFWDGRVDSLEVQVLRPIEDPREMDQPVDEAAARVGLTRDELSRALASYVRSILSGNSPYDRHAFGDRQALTDLEQAGRQVFRRSNCPACHISPTFTDERFHDTGVAWRPSTSSGQGVFLDDGRFLVTGQEKDRGAFKTPTLREVARTAPYMHDGSLATLDAVVEFYDGGGRPNPNLDPEIRPLHLSVDDKQALVAFLRALSGDVVSGVSGAR